MIRVAIPGSAGRMGCALVQAVAAAEGMTLAAATETPGAPAVGLDAGTVAGLPPLGVTVSDDPAALLEGVDGVIDFSAMAATLALAPRCAEAGLPLVIGTTGFDDDQLAALREAAERAPLVLAPNMSVGVNVLFKLVDQAARLLGQGYDLEVVESHHHNKRDAPSGTARRIVEVLAEATAEQGALADRERHGRVGDVGARPAAEIGIHAVRGGDIVGEHTVMYCGDGERVEITHKASSRQTFAGGALRALRWAHDRAPGFYDMQDVLGLRQ